MNILNINLLFDPASVGENLVRAINARGDHSAHHLASQLGHHGTEYKDIYYDTHDADELDAIFDAADILHFNQYDWTEVGRGVGGDNVINKVVSRIQPKHKIIYHGHGGYWLLNPEPQIERCRAIGAHIVTCSPMDIAVLGDSAEWIPNIINLQSLPQPDWSRDFTGEIIIGLAANHTAGVYKGVTMVDYMVGDLRTHFGFPLKLDLVSGLMRDEAIRHRLQHHMTVDNWVQGFTGMSGFEGLALGHVVFGRFDPMVREAWENFAPDMIPIVDIKGFDTCAARIREYCNDRDALIAKAHEGSAWMQKNYNDDRILNLWIDFYERVMDSNKKYVSNHYVNKRFDDAITSPPPGADVIDVVMGNSEYDEFEREKILEMLQWLDLDISGKMLDAGCGVGRNIPVLRARGFTDIEAADFSANMVDEFQKNYPDIPVMKTDLSNMPHIEDGRYEASFVMYVFIHITDDLVLSKAVAELERVTRGPVVIGQVMDPENKPDHEFCKGREIFELIPFFKKKKLDHFYKDYYLFCGKQNDWINKISFAVFK